VVARGEVEGGAFTDLAERDEVGLATCGDAVEDGVLDAPGCWASFTRAESCCAWATSAAFSSLGALATCLPKAFCSARSSSNPVIADRRAVSASIA
jgi:hypothetical protein